MYYLPIWNNFFLQLKLKLDSLIPKDPQTYSAKMQRIALRREVELMSKYVVKLGKFF